MGQFNSQLAIKLCFNLATMKKNGSIIFECVLFHSRIQLLRVGKQRVEQRGFVFCSNPHATCLTSFCLHHFNLEKERVKQPYLPIGFSLERVSQVISSVHCDWCVFVIHCSLLSHFINYMHKSKSLSKTNPHSIDLRY